LLASPATTDARATGKVNNQKVIANSISDRYDGEIASMSKMKQYEKVGDSYKNLLLKEAKDLSGQFSEDLQEAHKIEGSVEQISALLSEFSRIVQSQSHKVESIYDSGEAATGLVKQTDKEMQLTIDRSKNYQWNMVFLSVFLGVLLLVIDWITP
jgi:t-SNARE complex subunit (syntaxin)